MKKLFFLLFALSCIAVNAQQISVESAQNTALQFLNKYAKENSENATRSHNTIVSQELDLAYTATESNNSKVPLFYIFNIDKDNGYIIVSADSKVRPVLGIVEQGSFNEDELDKDLSSLLSSYSEQICYAKTRGVDNTGVDVLSRSSSKEIIPLLKDSWGQNSPYNSKCPTINGVNSKVGCVALAMAQVMNYWEYPAQGAGSHSYFWAKGGKTLSTDFSSHKYDWKKFYPKYGNNTQEEKDAIGTLMFDCGVSVNMDYGTEESLTYSTNAIEALKKYFGYSEVSHVYRDSYAGNWDDLLYSELSKGIPMIYSGENKNKQGHCFVCDGYKDGLFHFNWGWNGAQGFFATTALKPRENNYNYNQDIISARPSADYMAPEKTDKTFSIDGSWSQSY